MVQSVVILNSQLFIRTVHCHCKNIQKLEYDSFVLGISSSMILLKLPVSRPVVLVLKAIAFRPRFSASSDGLLYFRLLMVFLISCFAIVPIMMLCQVYFGHHLEM